LIFKIFRGSDYSGLRLGGLAPSAKIDMEISINTIKVQTKTMGFLAGAFVCRRDSWFGSKLASELQEIPLNVMLAMIMVVLGLSATLVTPILPLFGLGAIAFFLPFGRRATIKFLMMGALSIALGALTTVDLPLSLATTMRLEGSLFTTTHLEMLNLYSIFGIATIGILSLLFLKADCKSGIHSS
jgi:predicted cation transporter